MGFLYIYGPLDRSIGANMFFIFFVLHGYIWQADSQQMGGTETIETVFEFHL